MKPLILGIDGRSGAGKTELADALEQRIHAEHPELSVAVFGLDQLYRGWDGLEAGVALYTHELLPALAQGETVTYRDWDWSSNAPDGALGPERTFAPGQITIIEGFGTGARAAREHLNSLIWLNAPELSRRDRAVGRGGENYGPNWERWSSQEQDFTDRDRVESVADLVLDTSGPAESVQEAAYTMLRLEISTNGASSSSAQGLN
ncbi:MULTISPECIES: hypothetical protein [Auritidibacter]|uniref:hypothetical protein n=1 Tax=Auritidibacter TaxID=1160973 RepID=UPI000D732CAF|nr:MULTISPECIES: hypothetical protein [Auritidibacter]PXA79642.1 hypothetical protein DCC26_05225 [Auritidibacter sp. NML120779]PXA81063.1 hypothetical protein DCC25_04275 [Auritidibacter sp. NML120636]WGH83666.1 hypothetical protein QDX20_10445 [Auritidibacter ignavus]WGH85300.1 hypothetical protein QDX24_06800 [Auritidibacter ignavus]WGH87587.1 hypothetical protein QDX22_06795 [Auritidibacter ignavus]